MTIKEVVDARKTRIDADEAWQLLKDAGSVAVAKGRKVEYFKPDPAEKTAILKSVMGPSGNLRAPAFRHKDRFVVGFNAELYEDWVK